jgi:hypothetical protein
MSMLQALSARLPAIDTRSIGDIEREIAEELEFHLAMRIEDNVRDGLSPAEARAAALARFGDVRRIQQDCRTALLGERIMLQRLQLAIIVVLALAVAALAYQAYTTQRTMAELSSHLARLQGSTAASSPDRSAVVPAWEADRPRVIATFPEHGASGVDPATKEIRVTFDKEMTDESWSWVRSSAEEFPESAGQTHYLADHKTCVMPVKLAPKTKYVIWFNTANYQNFKDREGRPAVPHLLTFTTR